MKIRLTESDFRYMLTEMVKNVLLEAKLDPFYERVIHQYLSRFGGIRGTLPNCSKEELIQYMNQGLERAYHWAHTKNYTQNIQQFIRKLQHNFLKRIILNEKGLIYVERQMKFEKDINFNRLSYKSVGECWSWKPGNAQAYCDDRTYNINKIVLHGYVHPKDVDWIETLYITVYHMANETELRMSDNAKVELTDITVNGKKISLPATILVKADADRYSHDYSDENKYPNLDDFRKEHFQDSDYSVDDDYSLLTLLKQGKNIIELCDEYKQIADNQFMIKFDGYYNIYNKSNNSVVFGVINNIDTWPNSIGNDNIDNLYWIKKNGKENYYNINTKEVVFGDVNDTETWPNGISYDYIDNLYWIKKNGKENYYNINTKEIVFGDVNDTETWPNKMNMSTLIDDYYVLLVNNRYNIIHLKSDKIYTVMFGNKQDINTWCDYISYMFNNTYLLIKGNKCNIINNDLKLLIQKPIQEWVEFDIEDNIFNLETRENLNYASYIPVKIYNFRNIIDIEKFRFAFKQFIQCDNIKVLNNLFFIICVNNKYQFYDTDCNLIGDKNMWFDKYIPTKGNGIIRRPRRSDYDKFGRRLLVTLYSNGEQYNLFEHKNLDSNTRFSIVPYNEVENRQLGEMINKLVRNYRK